MKKIAFLALLLGATTGFGAMVEQDMMELRVQGRLDFDNPGGYVETDINLGLGYFIMDDLQLGGLLAFVNEGSDAGFGLGVYSEMLFDLNYAAAPFVGGSLQFRFGEYYPDNHLMIEFNGGLKVFLTEYLAVSGMIFFDIATDDVFINNKEAQNHDAGMRLGLNVYF